jgi:hypothetical protein
VLFFGNVVLFVVFTLLGSMSAQALDPPTVDSRRRDS